MNPDQSNAIDFDGLSATFALISAAAAAVAVSNPQLQPAMNTLVAIGDAFAALSGVVDLDELDVPAIQENYPLALSMAKIVSEGAAGYVGYIQAVPLATIFALELTFTAGILVTPFGAAVITAIFAFALSKLYIEFAEFVFDGYIYPLYLILTDPLTLDLDGDGIELISLANSNVNFDLDGNGFAERTGWVSSDDGMLVRDGNRNGNVDSVAELFGSATQDGFAVLETFDDNQDGRIDASDAVFADLKVWRDLNQNGVSESGELFTLGQLGIQSISGQELQLAA